MNNRSTTVRRGSFLVTSIFLMAAMASIQASKALAHDPLPQWQGELPTTNFDHPPEKPFNSSDYVFKFDRLDRFYRFPGEFVYRLIGENYGFEALSIFITETHPSGGPRLHSHDVEEAHVLLEGAVKYVIGDHSFTVQGPYVAKVPPNVPHTFMNAGSVPMHIIAVFPSKRPGIKILGPNPLVPSPAPR